ncbi:hypothetical protein NUW58_g2641 [Xylaria curta]|uniref:Uncharacterized protein n=2 Tax=Xylaria curta TaxID=42375 RepID=A0ACC1PGY7_9PEZI|nr:hypothetical protein NUW58_g2827 [Xylaria curta]KAJ2991114.1 hypothetical protein NUW58_g2641 [Xylaria curta]
MGLIKDQSDLSTLISACIVDGTINVIKGLTYFALDYFLPQSFFLCFLLLAVANIHVLNRSRCLFLLALAVIAWLGDAYDAPLALDIMRDILGKKSDTISPEQLQSSIRGHSEAPD